MMFYQLHTNLEHESYELIYSTLPASFKFIQLSNKFLPNAYNISSNNNMKFSTAFLALPASLTAALPSPQAPVFPLPPADTIYYYFRSSLIPGQGDKTKYDNLYIVAYHTGAGLSAATLQSAPLNPHRGWFNGTQLRWFEPTTTNDVVFGFAWGSGTSYDLWYPVRTYITVSLGYVADSILRRPKSMVAMGQETSNSMATRTSSPPTIRLEAGLFAIGLMVCRSSSIS